MGLGAVKLRDFIYTAVEQCMTDELVNKFTWLGDKETEQLQDTKMMNIIYCKRFCKCDATNEKGSQVGKIADFSDLFSNFYFFFFLLF